MRAPLIFAFLCMCVAIVLAGCPRDFLNPDPVHGGECRNGDQECHYCPGPKHEQCNTEDGSWLCTSQGECWPKTPDPIDPIGKRAKDAGR